MYASASMLPAPASEADERRQASKRRERWSQKDVRRAGEPARKACELPACLLSYICICIILYHIISYHLISLSLSLSLHIYIYIYIYIHTHTHIAGRSAGQLRLGGQVSVTGAAADQAETHPFPPPPRRDDRLTSEALERKPGDSA